MTVTMIPLSDLDLLQFTGPDSLRLLQGQLTCNMQGLCSTQALPGAYCTVKGRIVADFIALLHDDDILLRCQTGMAEILQQALSKYAVFFDTSMNVVTHQWQRTGLLGAQAAAVLEQAGVQSIPAGDWQCVQGDGYMIVRMPGPELRFELLTTTDHPLLLSLTDTCESGKLRDWQLADIQSGLFPISRADSEQFTPQVLNHDLLGFVDFRKGCYTGQEIIARMHYRGKAKRRLHTLRSRQPLVVTMPPTETLYVSTTAIASVASMQVLRVMRDAEGIIWLQAVLDSSVADRSAEAEGGLILSAADETIAELIPVIP